MWMLGWTETERATCAHRQNRHPHPQFKLDHFTTACVALAMEEEGAKSKLFEHARRNIARRAVTQSR